MDALFAAVLALPVALPAPAVDADPAAGAPRPAAVSLTLAPAANGDWTLSAIPETDAFDWSVGRGGTGGGNLTFTFNLAAMGRYTLPYGPIENSDAYFVDIGVVVIPDHLRYNDLFPYSMGFGVEIDLTLDPSGSAFDSPRYAKDAVMGGYVALQADILRGDRLEDDDGNVIEPDDMEIYSALIGFKVAQSMGEGILGEMRIGIGASYSPSVNATFGSLLVPDAGSGELFEETWHFLFESRIHAGYRLGPLAIIGGVGGRIMTAPKEGDGVTVGSLSPGLMFLIDFDLGVELGF
jgi:hypothetical protein